MIKHSFNFDNPYLLRSFTNKSVNLYYYYKRRHSKYFLFFIKRKTLRLVSKYYHTNRFNLDYFTNYPKNQELLDFAHRIVNGHLKIFIIGEKKIKKIDWHIDYTSGYRWPQGKFYKNYKIVDLNNNADVKIPWELSRCHHFLILGQAYLMTKDEKYTDKFIEHILDWIKENQFMKSINWTCTMEVAIRAVNWIYAYKMFSGSKKIDDKVNKTILTSLYQHGYFIFRNPERTKYNNHNHYLSDLAGQIHLAIFFTGFPEADIWLEDGIFEFYKEIRTQILPTGPTYERSTNYHRLVTELIAYTVILLDRNNYEIPSDVKYRVKKMFDFIVYYLRPDGTAPIIGDQDDGRFLPFSINRNTDHRYLLTIGAIYFQNSLFKALSIGYNSDSFFILGNKSEEEYDALKLESSHLVSQAFEDAGFFVMRHLNNYMFINLSGMGRYPEVSAGTHTHSDLLSFDLFMHDKSFIVDTGTYLYSADPGERLKFRSTAMHNTVVVDGEDQNILERDKLWGFERNAIPSLLKWEGNEELDVFEGSHNGYARLEFPVIHKRKIIFKKLNNSFEIIDELIGQGVHLFEWFYHFDLGISLLEVKPNMVITSSMGKNISLIFESNKPISLRIYEDYISKGYGNRDKANVLKISATEPCPMKLNLRITLLK